MALPSSVAPRLLDGRLALITGAGQGNGRALFAPLGVRVNALAPGVIETPMTAVTRANPERLQTFMTRIPMGRLGQPEDLVGPVIFLASDMSRYVTGITLAVDGGFLAV